MSDTRQAGLGAAIDAAVAALGMEDAQVTTLPGGAANRSVRIRDARRDVVLRFAGPTTAALGASRASEIAMQGLAAGAGLAPALCLADPDSDFIVSAFVDGRVPRLFDMRRPDFLLRVGDWIARLHRLKPPQGLPVVDFGERAGGYLERAQRRGQHVPAAQLARQLELRRAALGPPARLAACHHDLQRRNFVDSGDTLRVFDWEYAGPGDPAADLASCIGYHDLEPAGIDALLAGYGADCRELRERLEGLRWIFDCLWFGWNAIAALEGLRTDTAFQARLRARLVA